MFGGDPAIVGSATLLVGGASVTVVGVAAERFQGIAMDRTPIQLWMPLAAQRQLRREPGTTFLAVGRLRPGVTPAAATAAVRLVAQRAAAADDSLRALAPSAEVVPLLAMNSDAGFDRDIGWMAFLVGVLALLVLLVTCTNVSALLMGLAAARQQEIAVRLSLGAARGRLVRQMLTESVLLAAAAGATALGVAWGVLRLAARGLPALPFELGITWPATAFALGVGLAVGVGFGLAPALHGTRVSAAGAMRDSARSVAGGRGRLQRGLVVAQIAFTQPLIALVATVLLVALGQLQPRRHTELGDRLITVRLRPPVASDADASPAAAAGWVRVRAAMRRVSERLPTVGGVAGVVTEWPGASPLGGYTVHPDDRVPGAPEEPLRLTGERASPGYFAALGVPVVRGRDFAAAEVALARPRPAQAAVVIGADVARRLWGEADPVGRRLAASDSALGPRTLIVVGVIDDPLAKFRRAGEDVRIYLPPDTSEIARALLVRTTGDAALILPAVRRVVHEDASELLSEVGTVAAALAAAEHDRRVVTADLRSRRRGAAALGRRPLRGGRFRGRSADAGDRGAHVGRCARRPDRAAVRRRWAPARVGRARDRAAGRAPGARRPANARRRLSGASGRAGRGDHRDRRDRHRARRSLAPRAPRGRGRSGGGAARGLTVSAISVGCSSEDAQDAQDTPDAIRSGAS